ncbi:hypothetical protein [Phenylobacterium sp.]|uniref:hypothetical protein n=1 Tax=Phenylobacterium sp. TaxID=1871053 RepID=UPI0027315237|nr:hypothetical protein [Phenylobacterium sp.]MDP1986323.1 hypothetical protein [Phenylobacterium sp.]
MLEHMTDARRHWEPINYYLYDLDYDRVDDAMGWMRPNSEHLDGGGPMAAEIRRVLAGGAPRRPVMARVRSLGSRRSLQRIASAPATLIKFVFLQRALDWVARETVNEGVVLLRNPLAVVASQLNHPFTQEGVAKQHPQWTDEVIAKAHPIVSPADLSTWPHLANLLKRELSREERIAVTACLDIAVPLASEHARSRFAFASYEGLVASPESFGRLAASVGLKVRRLPRDVVDKPSRTTAGDSNVLSERDPRLSWKSRLSEEATDQVLAIMRGFDLHMYSTSPDIDLSALKSFGLRRLIV